ncbi:plasma membrane ammonium transporter [Pyronema domesticum]|uniref:Similar to Protein alcS acc. no. Q24JP1 n=1 Tax=Pyronema omphalodes (strain CBS 100304) TaxID=1076935 RepID=U4L5C3_PYROM|nr:plasma membrane ammonium transporter [Pyronema domesticum]CCX11991.1 Similar to Protein alcS; acc. no. Q24JP1 [Pyronema omphalodes CBS 100304]
MATTAHIEKAGGSIGTDERYIENLTRTATIPTELFDNLYLAPKPTARAFANPTPLALAGFIMTTTPLSMQMIGWRGAEGTGAASVGISYFFGGLLMILGGMLEFVIGNTFSMVVFTCFGGFWLASSATLTPAFNAIGHFKTADFPTGAENPQFYDTFGFFYLSMVFLCTIFFICSLRTNIVFAGVFIGLVIAYILLTATYWSIGLGYHLLAGKLQVAAGWVLLFVVAGGWWVFTVGMLASVDFPINLPVGDLSGYIKGASHKKAQAERAASSAHS